MGILVKLVLVSLSAAMAFLPLNLAHSSLSKKTSTIQISLPTQATEFKMYICKEKNLFDKSCSSNTEQYSDTLSASGNYTVSLMSNRYLWRFCAQLADSSRTLIGGGECELEDADLGKAVSVKVDCDGKGSYAVCKAMVVPGSSSSCRFALSPMPSGYERCSNLTSF